MALTDTSYGEYLAKVRGSESGGNPNAKNPRSSASGLYQFTRGTWEGLGYDWGDRFNTGLQNQAMSKLTSSNANYLKSKLGINPSDADLYGAHFLGPQGYASIYKTSSNTPLSSILSQGVISANPFLSGKTTGYLKNWLSNKMGQGVSQASYDEYGVDTSLNLPMNTGEYQTAPDIASKEDLEAEQAKAELLQKQNEKNFIAEVQAQQDQDSQRRQQQEEQYQQYQQQDTGIDEAYYQMPQIALPEYIPPQQEQFQVGGFKYTVTGNNPIVIPPQGSYPLSYRDRGNIDTDGTLFSAAKKVSRVDENGKPLTRNQIAENQIMWNAQKQAYSPGQQAFNIWKNNEENTKQGYFIPQEYNELVEERNSQPDVPRYEISTAKDARELARESNRASGPGFFDVIGQIFTEKPGCIYTDEDKSGVKKQNGGLIKYQTAGRFKNQTGPMTSRDSVAHQADKILKYEVLRGGSGSAPLDGTNGNPDYRDPRYKKQLMDRIYPEVQKILPNASAIESAEAMDLIFNSGWDDAAGKIVVDPRAYALQEYYRKNDPSKLDENGAWAGRKNAPYSFDKEYANTVGKLSENQRRIFMNKGRDWFYQHRAPKNSSWDIKTQGPHPNYKDTWYGRIWNTNDFNEFNPNNPKFIKKEDGGEIKYYQNELDTYEDGGELSEFDDNSARDWWVKKTGKSWKEAKKLGYTDGTANSNIKLLNQLKDKNFTLTSKNQKASPRSDMKQFYGFSQEEQDYMQNQNPPVSRKTIADPIAKAKKDIKEANQISLFEKVMRGDFIPKGNERKLQNGVITDKRTNTSYIIENGNIKKSFPVLTGVNPDMNINDKGVAYLETHPESKATPRGTYTMNPNNNVYGQPGVNLKPVAAFGEGAPRATDIAMHVTYPGEFDKRNPLYTQEAKDRYSSYGCVNCRKPDINYVTNRFKKGDTTMVIDSKIKKDANFLAKKLFSRK